MNFTEKINEYIKLNIPDASACVITYGCQQNESDSEKMKGILSEMGYKMTDDPVVADFVLYNTCAVRAGAEERVLSNVGALKASKAKNPGKIIGICGCMSQQKKNADFIMRKFRHVDFVMGTQAISKLAETVYSVIFDQERKAMLDEYDGIYECPFVLRSDKYKASVSVMYGCNNFCTYCIVPFVRGRERSRLKENIIAEVKELVSSGCKEITLLGQNVNSYGRGLYEDYDFADLVYDVANTGIPRLRFMTSHPKDISDRLIDVMAECENVCESLHLPFQSGSNRILKAMNRVYTREEYLEKIEKVKNKIPGVALTSDVIIGFPNETEEDVKDTISLVEKVRFDSLFTFIYSRRDGTLAAMMEDKVSDEVKHKHFNMLLERQNIISKEINDSYVGRELEILVEGISKNNPEMMTGRTRTNKIINFAPVNAKEGEFINVKVTDSRTWSLYGEEKGKF